MGADNHLTVVPSNVDQYKNSEADSEIEDFAIDIVKRTHFETDQVEVIEDQNEVYVNVQSYAQDPLAGMDDVCVIAFDHGFVPQGIIRHGAALFMPRDAETVNDTID